MMASISLKDPEAAYIEFVKSCSNMVGSLLDEIILSVQQLAGDSEESNRVHEKRLLRQLVAANECRNRSLTAFLVCLWITP